MTSPYHFIDKLSDHLQQYNALEEIISKLQAYNLIPSIGVEIEFYLSENIDIEQFELLLGIQLKQEKGKNQFEIDLPPTTNIIDYIEKIHTTKHKIENIAKKLQGTVNFYAKPFLDDYGNSMHFHISFSHSNSLNVDINILNKAADSIAHYMLDSFLIFFPYSEDYLRLDKNFMAPTTLSFGNNNRTVALRIPDSYPKRLEHRLAVPLTNIYIAIFTILNSILLGLQFPASIDQVPKIYGNAFDEQYNLPLLPRSLEEALKLFKLEFFIPNYVEEYQRKTNNILDSLHKSKKLSGFSGETKPATCAYMRLRDGASGQVLTTKSPTRSIYAGNLFDNGQSNSITLESLLEIIKKL